MTIAEFDRLDDARKMELLHKCCGSYTWVHNMLTVFPVDDLIDLLEYADEKWNECKEEDWLEAFKQHPAIGDSKSLHEKFADTADWAEAEQSGTAGASHSIIESLAEGNKLYKDRFDFIFIVYATGKSAWEMLDMLQKRLHNSRADEIQIAAEEQIKITKNRLEKLFA